MFINQSYFMTLPKLIFLAPIITKIPMDTITTQFNIYIPPKFQIFTPNWGPNIKPAAKIELSNPSKVPWHYFGTAEEV